MRMICQLTPIAAFPPRAPTPVANHCRSDHPWKPGDARSAASSATQSARRRDRWDLRLIEAIKPAGFRVDLGHWNCHSINSSGQVKNCPGVRLFLPTHHHTLRSQPMRLSTRNSLGFCLYMCLLMDTGARTELELRRPQHRPGRRRLHQQRRRGHGGRAAAVSARSCCRSGCCSRCCPNLPKLDPTSDDFDLVRTIEYSASPIHYIVGRDDTSTASAFITDLRNGSSTGT